jgi:hypothetical protein
VGRRLQVTARAAARAFAEALRPPPVWAVAICCAIAPLIPVYWWVQAYAPLHPDSMIYYGAARLALTGQIDAIFDPYRMTDFLNALFLPEIGNFRFHLAPWLYPPIFLLAVVPFALLPFGWFYGLLQVSTAATAAMALGSRRGGGAWLGVAALLVAPATALNFISGQNALLSIAQLVGGFRLLASHPLVAGALLGTLAYKPQLALLVPIALVAARAWRSLAAAAASAFMLVVASMAAFGAGAWVSWAGELLNPPGSFAADWLRDSLMRGFGVYICALRLGAPPALALGIQIASAVIAAAATYRIFRSGARWELCLAVLLCGTALTTPHIAPYDLALVACAVVLIFTYSFPSGFMPGEALALGLVWVVPVIRPADALIGAFAPLAISLAAGYAMAKVLSGSQERALLDQEPLARRPRSEGAHIDKR